jgi:hypothetical protein
MGEELFIANFEDADVFSRYLPPAGEYVCKIESEPTMKVASTGTQQLLLLLSIVAANDPAQQAEAEGKVFGDFISLSPKAAFRLKQVLVSAGIIDANDKTSEIARGKINTSIFKDQTVRVKVTHRFFEGKEKADVEYLIG